MSFNDYHTNSTSLYRMMCATGIELNQYSPNAKHSSPKSAQGHSSPKSTKHQQARQIIHPRLPRALKSPSCYTKWWQRLLTSGDLASRALTRTLVGMAFDSEADGNKYRVKQKHMTTANLVRSDRRRPAISIVS